MEKDLFKSTEEKLYRYYSKDKHISALKKRIILLDQQIELVDKDLRENNFSIEPESTAQQYTERVQTSGSGTSYVEREIMRVTEAKIKRKAEKELERQNILERIDKIELDADEIEWKIEDFSQELRTLLELKYKKKYGEQKIAMEMHIDQSQVNRRKQQIIRKIALWDMW